MKRIIYAIAIVMAMVVISQPVYSADTGDYIIYLKKKPFKDTPFTMENGITATFLRMTKKQVKMLNELPMAKETEYKTGYPWQFLNLTGKKICDVQVVIPHGDDTSTRFIIGDMKKGFTYMSHGKPGQYRHIVVHECDTNKWYFSEGITTLGSTFIDVKDDLETDLLGLNVLESMLQRAKDAK